MILLTRLVAATAALGAHAGLAATSYPVSGLVVRVDPQQLTVVVSHENIPRYMDAMVMPFRVRTPKALEGLHPGGKIEFTLSVDKDSSWMENIRVVEFNSSERDPVQARRLMLLGSVLGSHQAPALTIGQSVPDFTLIDQNERPVTLSKLAGKVVAMNFIYTRCPLPDYCFRLSNHLGSLQKRFAERMSRDLILLTITFDPAHDRPDVLAKYARIWKADALTWRFLTGSTADVQRVCAMFGVGFWQDEGMFTHSLHTVVIDRRGRLAADIEGNRFTAQQLGDLVEAVLQPGR